MRPSLYFISLITIISLCSCKESLTDYATKWTQDIKAKIIEDSNKKSDSTAYDSVRHGMALFSKGVRLKSFGISPETKDTLTSSFYSPDQNFKLVRELCPLLNDEWVEVIAYKDSIVGLHEFYYCNGKIKQRGFNVNGKIGVWTEYNAQGNIVKETDNGNIDRLEKLKAIKYYR